MWPRFLVACWASRHYSNQCIHAVQLYSKYSWNQLQWRLNHNTIIFIHEMHLKISPKPRPFCSDLGLLYYITITVYPKKYAHGFCFAVLCCGYTLTDFPISIRLTSLALWQSNDCPSASKATLMNMDKYFMWIHYERLYNHNKAKHNKTVCTFLGIYCTPGVSLHTSLLCSYKGALSIHLVCNNVDNIKSHDDVIKWKHFPRNWPFVRGIHRSGEFPTQRPVTRSFDVFFDLCLNKRLSKHSWGWWFETLSRSLWRHHNVLYMFWKLIIDKFIYWPPAVAPSDKDLQSPALIDYTQPADMRNVRSNKG